MTASMRSVFFPLRVDSLLERRQNYLDIVSLKMYPFLLRQKDTHEVCQIRVVYIMSLNPLIELRSLFDPGLEI